MLWQSDFVSPPRLNQVCCRLSVTATGRSDSRDRRRNVTKGRPVVPAPEFSPSAIADLLQSWLQSRLDPVAGTWLTDKLQAAAAGDRKSLFLSFGLTARKTGKDDLQLTPEELTAATRVRPGWNPQAWTIDQAARVLFLLRYPSLVETEYVSTLDQLFAAAEVHELLALYQGLPLYPHQSAFQLRCAEGQRTNIPAVFRAIAHANPFPCEQLNEAQWNQLILKSLFIGVALDPIVGLDQRANASLARMLLDFARERRAAGRPIPPELWRCVGPFADDAAIDMLQNVLTTGTDIERQAATLALRSCPHPAAAQFLKSVDLPTTPSW